MEETHTMRYLIPLIMLGLFAAPAAIADSDATKTMAGILADLNHFPTDDDKQALEAIAAGDASEHERAVATALMNVQHRVQADDRAALEAVVADDSASSEVKALAEVLLGLNHTPSDADKRRLRRIAGS